MLIVGQSEYVDDACQGGGGSSKVDPLYTVTPVDGMRDVLAAMGSDATVSKVTVADDLSNLDEAKAAAREADTVIIMAGLVATEGVDRPDAHLPNDQSRMIDRAARPQRPHRRRPEGQLPGADAVDRPGAGRAGGVEPGRRGRARRRRPAVRQRQSRLASCRPPIRPPSSDTLYYGDPVRYPGTDEGSGYPVIRYTEGRQVGYRWFQAQGISPLFAFGFGLSYTTFELSDVAVSTTATDGTQPINVSLTVTNTGSVAGAEVPQVYLGVPSQGQPPKRLVGFTKVHLAPGEAQRVTITIDPAATNHPLSVWDPGTNAFVVPQGEFAVHVGTSSDDTPHTAAFSVS